MSSKSNPGHFDKPDIHSPLGAGGHVIVVADDLTGAAEIGGVGLRYGLKVSFCIDQFKESDAELIVVATDSRSASEEEAYQTHYNLTYEILEKKPDAVVFKKCDSVLRGYILSELAAMKQAGLVHQFILQPTNPSTGRVIRNGKYYVQGQLINETGFLHDPDFPARVADVTQLLLNRSKRYAENLGKIEVSNCESSEDMRACLMDDSTNVTYCGSSVFFEQMLIKNGYSENQYSESTLKIPGNKLIVLGSTHPQSRKFIERMSIKNILVFSLPEFLLQKDFDESDFENWINKIVHEFSEKHLLILTIADHNIEFEGSSLMLKKRLTQAVFGIMNKCEINECFIEGGATAYDILKKLELNVFEPVQELFPGVVKMKSIQKPVRYFVLKPGSYLWPESLF